MKSKKYAVFTDATEEKHSLSSSSIYRKKLPNYGLDYNIRMCEKHLALHNDLTDYAIYCAKEMLYSTVANRLNLNLKLVDGFYYRAGQVYYFKTEALDSRHVTYRYIKGLDLLRFILFKDDLQWSQAEDLKTNLFLMLRPYMNRHTKRVENNIYIRNEHNEMFAEVFHSLFSRTDMQTVLELNLNDLIQEVEKNGYKTRSK